MNTRRRSFDVAFTRSVYCFCVAAFSITECVFLWLWYDVSVCLFLLCYHICAIVNVCNLMPQILFLCADAATDSKTVHSDLFCVDSRM